MSQFPMNIRRSQATSQQGGRHGRWWTAAASVLALVLILASGAWGANSYTYTGLSGGAWGLNTNWNPVGVPGTGDSVLINTAVTVTLDAARTVGSVTFDVPAAGVASITPGAGTTLTIDANGSITNASGSTGLKTISCAVSKAGATTITNNDTTGAIVISGIISGSGILTKAGTGTVTLSGANSFTGTTTVSGGVLALQNTYASTSHSIASGAVLELNVASGTRDLATTTFSGGGTLRKTGTGQVQWGGTAATFALGSGALIDVQAGTMVGGSSANEVWTSNLADLNVATGAVFAGVEANVRVNKLTGGGTIQSGYSGAGYVNFTYGVDNGTGTFTGILANSSGTGNFVKLGTGSQTLGSVNTYTGTTTISAGTVVGGGRALGTGAVTVASGATLTVGGPGLMARYYSIAPVTAGGTDADFASLAALQAHLNGRVPTLMGATTSMNCGGTGANFPAPYTSTGSAFESMYNGNITVGTTGFYTFNTASDDGSMIWINGTQVVNNNFTHGLTTVPGAITLTANTVYSIVIGYYNGGGGLGLNAQISGPGNLTMADINTANAAITTPDLAISSLAGGGSVVLAGGDLLVGDGTSTTFSGVISGTGDLVKYGTGILTLSGNNSYSGTTTIWAGGVQVGSAGTTGTLGAGAIANSGTLTFARSDALPVANAITGTGPLVQAGAGTLTLSGLSAVAGNNYSGLTTIDKGTLAFGADTALTGGVTFGLTNAPGGTVGILDLTNASLTCGPLAVQVTNATANQILIGSGKTLTVNGNVTVGPTLSGTPAGYNGLNTTLTVSGLGAWVVNGGTGTFAVGDWNSPSGLAYNANLNMSGLASFTLTQSGAGNMRLGRIGDNAVRTCITTLAATSTITTPTLTVGEGSSGSIVSLKLGSGVNTLNVNTLNIGTGGRDSGSITFNGASGSLYLWALDGSGRANVNMQTGGAGTGATATNTIDTTGHTAAFMIDNLIVGGQPRGGAVTNDIKFNNGTLDVTTFQLGAFSGSGSAGSPETSTLTVGGGTVTIGAGGLNMGANTATGATANALNATVTITGGTVTVANNPSLAPGAAIRLANNAAATTGTTVNGLITITGGTLNVLGDIINGAGTGTSPTTATLTLNGGTLNMAAHAIGSLARSVTFNAQVGTLDSLSQLNGGGTLTKTTAGTLLLSGAHTYTGGTSVGAGTLGGSGSILSVIALGTGGTLAPGMGGTTIGTLQTNGVTCTGTPTWSVDLNSTGGLADLINAPGQPVALTGTLTIASVSGNYGGTYTLVSAGSVTGTFTGLPDGAVFIQQNRQFTIHYNANNTVTLNDRPQTYKWVGLGPVDDNWSTAANWDNNFVPPPGADVVFAGTLRPTPNYDGAMPTDMSLASITFDNTATGFTLGGGRITLAGAFTNNSPNAQTSTMDMIMGATRTFNAATANLTIGGILSGAGGLTKTGANTLTLTGAGTYAGATTVSGGNLTVQAGASAIGTLSLITQNGGSATIAGTVTLASSASSVFGAGYGATGTGTVTVVTGGALSVGNGNGLVFVGGGPSAGPYGNGILTISGGTVTVGATTLALPNDRVYLGGYGGSGVINLDGGTLQSSRNFTKGSGTGTWNFNGGTLQAGFTSANFLDNSTFTLNVRNGGAIIDSNGFNISMNHAFAHSAVVGDNATDGGLTKIGTGTLTMLTANTYTGGTRINAGTMSGSLAGSFPTTGTVTVALAGTMGLSGNTTYTFPTLAGAGTVAVTLGTGTNTTTFPAAGGNAAAFTGIVNIGVGAAAGAGKAWLTVPLANTATVNVLTHGTLYLTGAITCGMDLFLNGGDTGESLGQLRLDSGATYAGAITLAGTMTGANDGFIGSSVSTGTISGAITETGGARRLIKVGGGTIVLTGTNTYSGGTTISGGIVQVGNAGVTGTLGTGSLVNNAALILKRTDTAYAIDDIISGTGTLTMDGGSNALVSLTGINTFSGAVTITSGGLRITDSNGLGTGTKTVTMTNAAGQPSLRLDGTAITLDGAISLTTSSSAGAWGGIINVGGTNTINGSITMNGAGGATRCRVDAGTLTLAGNATPNGAGATLILDGAGDGTFSGVLSGTITPALTKLGTGSWTLAGINTYTGATTVSAGALLVTGSTAAGSAVGVAGGATLGGTGTVSGTINLAAGATLAPGTGGSTVGTLTTNVVTGVATAVYAVDLDGAGPVADLINAPGNTVTISNMTLTLASIVHPVFASPYTIVSAGSVVGTFKNFPDGSDLLNGTVFEQLNRRFVITYTPTSVILNDVLPIYVWSGGGADDYWTTAANWTPAGPPRPGSELVFTGNARTTPVYDFANDTVFNRLVFTAAANQPPFTMVGKDATHCRVALMAGIANSTVNAQTIGLDLVLASTCTFDAASGDIACSGALSGTGGLTKTGTGILTLAGAGTYTGATTLSSGTLLTLGGLTSSITAAASTTLGASGIITGNLTSAGILAPQSVGNGIGVLTVNGGVTASGTLRVRVNNQALVAGTDYDQLVVNGPVNLHNGSVVITGNASGVAANQVVTLILNDGVDPLVPALSPAEGGSVVVGGASFVPHFNGGSGNDLILIQPGVTALAYVDNVNFAALNPGQDITDADQGTLASQSAIMGVTGFVRVGDALNAVTPPASVTVNGGSYAEAATLSGVRALIITGPDAPQAVTIGSLATVPTDPLATPAGQLIQVAGTSTLIFGDAVDTTIACPIAGTGNLVKQGVGKMTLAGACTTTGSIAVNAGTLVTGALGSGQVTVAQGATLQATGNFDGWLTNNGTVAVNGGAIGTLTVAGNVVLNGTSTWKVDVDGNQADRLVTTGTVALDGNLSVASYTHPVGVGVDYVIISATTVTGTFAGLPDGATIPINGRVLQVQYRTGSVTLHDLNSAPVLDPKATPTLENVRPGASDPVGVVGTLVSSLVQSGGLLNNVNDLNADALTGLAVTQTDEQHGFWWFSLDGGTNWAHMGTVSDTSALLLRADTLTRVYFAPAVGWSGLATMTFRAWDQTDGTAVLAGQKVDVSANGGSSPYSAVTDQALALVGLTWVDIAIADQIFDYDGTAKVAVYTASPNVACSVTYTDWNVVAPTATATPPTQPGTYAVKVTVTAANYLGEGSAWLTINEPPVGTTSSSSSGGGCGSGSGLVLLLVLALLALFRLSWAGGMRRP